jgi:hypothetical protein
MSVVSRTAVSAQHGFGHHGLGGTKLSAKHCREQFLSLPLQKIRVIQATKPPQAASRGHA